jgi:hypothetical protein
LRFLSLLRFLSMIVDHDMLLDSGAELVRLWESRVVIMVNPEQGTTCSHWRAWTQLKQNA